MPGRESIERYVTKTVRPPDFERFWAEILDTAASVPLNPALEPVPERSTPEVEVYEIAYDSLDGLRIAGWYCVPRASVVPPPYPGLVIVPGYISEPTLPKTWAKRGYAAVGVAPRGKLRSNQRFNPGYPGLLVHNIVDRHTYAYRGFYVDACRAVDFLLSRPEVDRRRIGVHGSSQGGALTVVVAALRAERIACGAAGAPFLCGFLDAIELTRSYPYEEIREYLRCHPEQEPYVRETLMYYDVINFAPMVRCPMLLYIGLEDDVCPPETGYALYHVLSCPKELLAYPECAHDAGSYWAMPNVTAFLAEYLEPVGVSG